MHPHSGSRFWRGSSLSVLSTGISLLLTLFVPATGSGWQRENPPRSELGLEISLPDDLRRPLIRLAHGGGGMTLIRRESLKINDPKAAGEFTAIDVRAEVEGTL
ncbi:MAG: hypothetical protein AABN33_05680 [Acidobacteriota bacterium]